jgi:predicted porin
MKTTKTSVVTKSVLALAAVASLNAFAGPKPASAACAACDGAPFSGSLSADYTGALIFRGLDLGNNVLSTNLNVSVPLAEGFSLSLGSSVARGLSANGRRNGDFGFQWNTYSAGLNYDAGVVKVGLVYNQYDNTQSSRQTALGNSFNEIGLTVSASVGEIDFSGAVYRDLDNDSWYTQASVGTSVEVTSAVKLVPSLVAGYGFSNYYAQQSTNPGDDGLTHVAANLAAPIKVTKNATLTPYASWNLTGDQRAQNQHNSQLIGGLKFSVGF